MNLIRGFKSTDRFESTDRSPADYFHFGVVFLGLVIAAAGIVALSVVLYIFGLLLAAWGLAYFWMEE